jgi:hypothetical protein
MRCRPLQQIFLCIRSQLLLELLAQSAGGSSCQVSRMSSVSHWIAFVCRLVLSHGHRSSTITARLSTCGLAPACRRLCATAEDSDLALTQFLARVPILPEAPRAVVATGILVLVWRAGLHHPCFCSTRFCCQVKISFVLCVDCCRNSFRSYLWATGSKSLMFSSSNCSQTVVSWTRPQGIRWNNYEDMNWFSIWFLSSVSHVFLPALICVSDVVSNSVSRVNSYSIAMWSWSS